VVDAPDAGWTSASTLAVLAGAAVLLAGFLLVETRSRAPLVPLQGLVTRVGPRPIAALSMALLGVGSLLLAQVSQAAFTACAIRAHRGDRAASPPASARRFTAWVPRRPAASRAGSGSSG
jgi:hypothetical protein